MKHININLLVPTVLVCFCIKLKAAELQASDGVAGDGLGIAVANSDGNCLTGAFSANVRQIPLNGACYFFRGYPTGTTSAVESAKLIPSDDQAPYPSFFGQSVALGGNLALVTRTDTYSVYVYQNLDSATGTISENLQIDTYQGRGISISATTALLGTSLYRHLDTALSNPGSDVDLSISSIPPDNFLCASNSLSGNSALVGYVDDIPNEIRQGAAYYYRDLSTATGTVFEDTKLVPPGRQANQSFGYAVSLSEGRGVVGAPNVEFDDFHSGEAYYFKNLDIASKVVVPQTRLQGNPANLSRKNDFTLAASVSLSGDNALLSADGSGACLYLHLDQTSGVIYEDVRIVSSVPPERGFVGFGGAVNLDRDKFTVGDRGRDSSRGAVYTGSVSALTTNDFGNSRKVAAYVSFISHLDWIAGETTDNNQIPLAAGDTATVKDAGKAVYIGKNAGSDNNLLDIAGTLNATYVYIGSTAVNTGNTLQVESTGKITASALRLAPGNRLLIAGTPAAAKTFLQKAPLQVWVAGAWKTVTPANYRSLVKISQANGFTVVVTAG